MATPIVTGFSPLGLSLRSLSPVSLPGFVSLSSASLRYRQMRTVAVSVAVSPFGWRVAVSGAVSVAVSPHWLARCRRMRTVAVSVANSPHWLARCRQR